MYNEKESYHRRSYEFYQKPGAAAARKDRNVMRPIESCFTRRRAVVIVAHYSAGPESFQI